MTRVHFYVLFIKGCCVYSSVVKQCLPSVNHEQFPLQMTTASTANGCKSSPKIFHWNSSGERQLKFIGKQIEEDNHEAERTSLSTAKATLSTWWPQTCTEAGTTYHNYTVNETNEERGHWLPTLQKATRLDQATFKVYGQNYLLLRCSDRQQELCALRISFQRTLDSRSTFKPWATIGFPVSFILQSTV